MAKNSKVIFSNGHLGLKLYTTKYRGYDFTVISKLDVVAVVALLGDGKILLERIYRPVSKKFLYEIPAGHVEKGERRKEAAVREMKEETGYSASKIDIMTRIKVSPGLLIEDVYIYLASGLKKGKSSPSIHEQLSLKIVSLEKALNMIKVGEIEDAKTIAGLLYYKAFLLDSPVY